MVWSLSGDDPTLRPSDRLSGGGSRGAFGVSRDPLSRPHLDGECQVFSGGVVRGDWASGGQQVGGGGVGVVRGDWASGGQQVGGGWSGGSGSLVVNR